MIEQLSSSSRVGNEFRIGDLCSLYKTVKLISYSLRNSRVKRNNFIEMKWKKKLDKFPLNADQNDLFLCPKRVI